MRIITLSGWGQPPDALAGVAPGARHVEYAHLASPEAALAAIAEAAREIDVAIGWSLGGQLLVKATAAGLIHPKRLVLIGVPFQFARTSALPLGLPRETYDLFRQNYAENPRRTLKKGWDLIAYQDAREPQVKAALARHDVASVLSRDWDRWLDTLSHSTCHGLPFAHFPPTLIVHGARDAVVWPEQAEHFARHLPHSRLELWPDCGHAPHWHDPPRLQSLISDFIQNRLPAALALTKKRAAMDTEKIERTQVRDIFEEAPSQADLKSKLECHGKSNV